jgi:hypothetical protein
VPPHLTRQPQIVLEIGLDMPLPILDLRVDDWGVLGTLSFNRSPFTCCVPWEAVFAVVGKDGMGMVWPDSLPPEVAAEVRRAARRAEAEELAAEAPVPAGESRRHLRPIAGGRSSTEADEPLAEEKRSLDRPPYLRVIK